MRFILLPIAVYVALVLQTTLAGELAIGRFGVDFPALLAALWLVAARGRYGMLVAGAIGLCGDLAASGQVGLGMGYFILAGCAIEGLRLRLSLDSLPARAATLPLTMLGYTATVAIGARALGDIATPWTPLLTTAVGTAVYTSVLATPALMVIGWVQQSQSQRRRLAAA